jgi:ubiquinone/menaquinone biosynthesis C-methylase UbiE
MAGKNTGWGAVAGEYGESFIKNDGSYHATVLLPNLLRVVEPRKGKKILEVGCGDGFFSAEFAHAGAEVEGSDIASAMISEAKQKYPHVRWYVASADNLSFAKNELYDAVVIVLALQNIEHLQEALKEVARVLKPKGSLVAVLNHPAFRIPKHSSWGFDEATDTQYRRLDSYLSESAEEIDMDPGKTSGKRKTISFHRPLQVYVKALAKNNFGIVGLEEWISNRKSENGPRQKAEDTSRKEFPLFLMLKAQKLTN